MTCTIYDTAGSYTFTPPDPAIEVVWADIWGAGSGGNGTVSYGGSGNAGGGGSSGEFVERKLIPIEGGTLAVVVGAGGTAGTRATGIAPGAGGQSSVGSVIALGGMLVPGQVGPDLAPEWGGGPLGGHAHSGGFPAVTARGLREGPCCTGGWNGGGGGQRALGTESQPKDAPGTSSNAVSGSGGGGGAGASSQWGPGGDGGDNAAGGAAAPGIAAPNNAAGGGGAASDSGTGSSGGAGGDGKVILYYIVAT